MSLRCESHSKNSRLVYSTYRRTVYEYKFEKIKGFAFLSRGIRKTTLTERQHWSTDLYATWEVYLWLVPNSVFLRGHDWLVYAAIGLFDSHSSVFVFFSVARFVLNFFRFWLCRCFLFIVQVEEVLSAGIDSGTGEWYHHDAFLSKAASWTA